MTAPRDRRGRWQPGASPNPGGKKRGPHRSTLLREQIAEALPDVLAATIERAKSGDPAASRLLLERVLPAIRPTEQGVSLVSLPTDGSIRDQARALLGATADAQIGPGAAAALLGALAQVARVVELDELAARIRALEGRDGNTE